MDPNVHQPCTTCTCPTTTTESPPCRSMSDAQFAQPSSVRHFVADSQQRNLSKFKRLWRGASEDSRSKNPSKTSGYRSSMSNVSGDSGWVCTEPSSSGSSQQAETQHVKHQKKEEIKRCLQELKSLMPRQARSSKTGTISTLQSLLHHMKKIKGSEETGKQTNTIDTELMGGLPEVADCSSFDYNMLPYPEEETKWMRIVLSARDSQVLQVSPELTDMLGYPKNYWFNQSLLDYAYKRDIVTLSNHLTFSGHDLSKHAQPSTSAACKEEGGESETQKMFFFRVRHFKSLRQGFSLSRGDKYSVLCGHVRRQKVNLSFPSGTPAEGLQPDSMYLVLECLPITSAYLNLAPETLPEKRSFTTRHTVYCNFNFVHPSAIPLLGYLPQDMIGSSVFDYYHPQDLPILLNVYQQVVMMPGVTVKCMPYRMRTKNGEYVRVETEWSSFVNPWTHHLDFIIGQHQVLSAPPNLDVFKETGHHKPHVEFSPEAKAIQKKIKSLLLPSVIMPQPQAMGPQMTMTSGETPCSTSIPPSSSEEPADVVREKEVQLENSPQDEEKASPSPPDSGEEILPKMEVPAEKISSQLAFYQDKRDLLYERLNYAQSIVRFLMSQVSEESESGHRLSQTVSKAEDNESFDDEEIAMEMELPIPKPPSFASSTKALVSEQEQREEFQPPSPSHEEAPDEGHPRDMEHDDIYQPISLTENALKMHNILQEQYYIQKMVREKEGFLTPDGRFSSMLMSNKSHKSSQKRAHSELNDGLHIPAAKFSRNMESKQVPQWHSMSASGHHLRPPFPITKIESIPTLGQPTHVTAPKAGGSSMATNITPMQVNNPGQPIGQPPGFMRMNDLSSMPSTSFSFYQDQSVMPVQIRLTSQHPGTTTATNPSMVSSATLAGYQWPCFSSQPGNMATRGMPFVQPIFYQPILTHSLQSDPVLSQSLTGPQLAVTTTPLAPIATTNPENTCKMHAASPARKAENAATPKLRGAKRRVKDNESSESLSMETSSSLLYLLESNSGSLNNSSQSDNDQLDDVDKKKKLSAEPPWLNTVEWHTDCMRHTLPQRDLKKVLREDRMALKKMKQPLLSVEQLQELLYQLDDEDQDEPLVRDDEEDTDVIFMSGDDMPLMMPSSSRKSHGDVTSTSDASSSPLSDHQPMSPVKSMVLMENSMGGLDIEAPEAKDSTDVEMEENIMVDKLSDEDSSKMQPSPPPTEETTGKARSSPDKIGNESDTSETGSKGSSELTPSDQRSHGDTGSSLKESDNASSGSSKEAKDNTETDRLFTRRHFCKLFIPLNVECDNRIQPDPSWLVGVNFSEHIQMEYQKEISDVKQLLHNDCRGLKCLQQPELVREQLKELVNSLDITGSAPVGTPMSIPTSTGQVTVLAVTAKAREEDMDVNSAMPSGSESKGDSDSGCVKTPSSNPIDSESDKDSSKCRSNKERSSEAGNTSDDIVTTSDDDQVINMKKSEGNEQSDDSQNDSGKSTGSGSGSGNGEELRAPGRGTWEQILQQKLRSAVHGPFFDSTSERNSSSPCGSGQSTDMTSSSTPALTTSSRLSSDIETLMGHLFTTEETAPYNE